MADAARPCRSCELVGRRDDGLAPPWDNILRTPYWDVVHAFDAALEGWLVLVARRHVVALAELTEAEAGELSGLLARVSQAQHAVLGCVKSYAAQFAEHPEHPHVHVHLVPRAVDHPELLRGPRVFAALGVDVACAVSEARRNELAERLSAELTAGSR